MPLALPKDLPDWLTYLAIAIGLAMFVLPWLLSRGESEADNSNSTSGTHSNIGDISGGVNAIGQGATALQLNNSGIINVGQQPFEMTNEVMSDIAEKLHGQSTVKLFAVGSSRSCEAVTKLANFLRVRGIETSICIVGVLVPPLAVAVEFREDGVAVNADLTR